jgi:hypothetical protein
MANWSPFGRIIQDKIDTINNKNNTLQMKLAIIKEMWQLILTDEGKDYITLKDDFRKVVERKVLECMDHPGAENEVQLQSISRSLLTVIENINLGKQMG